MFEALFVLAGFIVLLCNGPLWLGIVLLAIGGIWYFGDGDFDWF